jgi:hypothetical protein
MMQTPAKGAEVTVWVRTWFTNLRRDLGSRAQCFQRPAIEDGGPVEAGPCQEQEEQAMITEEAEEAAVIEAAALQGSTYTA